MKSFLVLLAMILVLLSRVEAKVKIQNIEFKSQDQVGKMTISYTGTLGEIPTLQYKPDTIQVTMKNTVVWPQINQDLDLGQQPSKLLAYQYDKTTARVRTILPFNTSYIEDKVQLDVTDGKLVLTFPIIQPGTAAAAVVPSAKQEPATTANVKDAKEIDEKYLNTLFDEKNMKKDSVNQEKLKNDSVNTKLASLEKELAMEQEGNKFSMMKYAGKFVAFLGFIMVLFYGIMNVFRKGAGKKGRLSFLGSTKQVEVLSTTYVAPKKSLVLVKAHKQVFLVSNTEQGMTLISEIQDPSGLFKNEEADIAGTNFDLNLNSAENDELIEEKVKLKENPLSLTEFINEKKTTEQGSVAKNAPKDKVKFSDQLKKKVKELKPLQ